MSSAPRPAPATKPAPAPVRPAVPPVRPGVATLPHSRIREVYTQIHNIPGLIPLWFGEPDQPTPAFINDAATRALAAGHTFYTPNRGIPELRQALSDYLSAHYETSIPVERICVTPSGMGAIMLVLQSLIDVGDEVVAISPVWSNTFRAVQMLGGTTRMVTLERSPGGSGGWRLDLDKLFAAVTEKTRVLVVTSPNNPTGWVMTEEEQRRVLEFTRARGIWLLADEVYDRLVFEQDRAPSFLRLATPEDLVVVTNSFSKSWAMTGWRLGWTVSMPGMVPILEKLNEINQTGAATFIQHAGVTAIREGEPFVRAQLERYRQNRDLVIQRLASLPRVSVTRPAGAFYAFFGVDGMTDSVAFAQDLGRKAQVGLAPGAAFGDGGEGHLRLCFAASAETLSRALDRLAPALS